MRDGFKDEKFNSIRATCFDRVKGLTPAAASNHKEVNEP